MIRKAKSALTWDELDKETFASQSEAALHVTRAIALLDSCKRDPKALSTVKAYLSMSKAALWLARDAHFRYNIDSPPTGEQELNDKYKRVAWREQCKHASLWLVKIISIYLFVSRDLHG